MIETRASLIFATLLMCGVSDAPASECRRMGGQPAMYRVTDDNGKVFFMDSPRHPACSGLIDRKIAADKRSQQTLLNQPAEAREERPPPRKGAAQ